MVAQAMIEEVALPIHAVFSRHILLPVFNHGLHSRLAREGEDGVQMIGREQAQPAMSREFLVIVFYRCQHGIAAASAAQLVFTPGHTIDGDEKPTALSHPLWNCVRQLFADGQIHGRSVTKSAQSIKYERQGASVPARRFARDDRAHGVTRPTHARPIVASQVGRTVLCTPRARYQTCFFCRCDL